MPATFDLAVEPWIPCWSADGDAWIDAATAAGCSISHEDHDVTGEYTAALMSIDDRWYELELRGDDVTATELR